MPAVKVIKGDQFHLFIPGRKHSKSFPAGHADLIVEFSDLTLDHRSRKWAATFTVIEPSKPNHTLKVYQAVLVADTEGLYSLGFEVTRAKPWPEIKVTFFPPLSGRKGQGVRIAVFKDYSLKDVRLSRNPHPAQVK